MIRNRIAIIGAGVAGLSAAIHARLSGYEVDVYERHTIPGGLCTSWRIDGYLFDGCVEYLVGSGPSSPFYELWKEVGVVPRPFVCREAFSQTIAADGQRVILWADPDRLEAHFNELAPEDAATTAWLCGLVRMMRVTKYRVDLAPELMRLGDHFRAIRAIWPTRKLWADGIALSVESCAARFKSPLLRAVLLTSLPPKLPLLALLHVLGDLANGAAGTPIGGSIDLALTMARRCKSLGARLHYGAGVSRVRVQGGRACGLELTGGHVVEADAVISAADLRLTLDHLLGGSWPSPAHEALFASAMVPSVCVLSFGLRGPLTQGADVILHRQLFDPPQTVAGHTISALGWKTFEHDPTLAPAPKTVLSVNLDSPYGFWKPLAEDRARYDEARAALGAGVRALLERAVPGFSSLVETVDVATPLTVERFTSNHGGQFMTFIPKLGRPPRHAPRQVPGLRDLWLAGMWVAPPGGLPNALKSGRDVVQVMCKAGGRPFHAA